MLVINSMHNLFEGLLQFHCCYILSIKENEGAEHDKVSASTEEVDIARNILDLLTSSNSAKGRIKTAALKTLCPERGISITQPGLQTTKKKLID